MKLEMRGYKIFDGDWKCRGKQYGVGEVTEQEGQLELCRTGLHYCESALACLKYIKVTKGYKFGEIEALGEVVGDANKKATNQLKVIRELSYDEFMDLCTGVDLEWHENGQLGVRSNYVRGQPSGLYEQWYENGKPKHRYNYVGGKLDGLEEIWFENGTLALRCNYVGGQLEGLFEWWNKNGEPKQRRNYVGGQLEGLYESWYETGNRQLRCNFVGGQMMCIYQAWDETGKETITSYFNRTARMAK